MMKYTAEELKEMIGGQAESIIANDLGIESSNSEYPCRITEHRKTTAKMRWLGVNFFCCDCQTGYDILNHAKLHHSDDFYGYLKRLAGISDSTAKVASKRTQNSLKSKPVKQEVKMSKFKKDFSGLQTQQSRGVSLINSSLNYMGKRGISEETCTEFGVTGDDDAIYLNYWSLEPGGKYNLCKIKGRKIGEIKNGQSQKYLGIPGGESILFGSHLYNNQPVLIICEGEFDCLSMHEGIKFVNAQSKVMAVSVPSGSGHNKWIETCSNFLDQFQTIVICSDLDEAGVKMRDTCAERMSNYQVKWIDLERFLNKDHHIDINDLLITKGKKHVGYLLKHIESIDHDCGFKADKIQTGGKKELFFTGFWGLDRVCKFEFGETTVLAGDSNDGKTTVARQMMISAIQNGHKVGCMFGEEKKSKFLELSVRQSYHNTKCFETNEDYYGDREFTPTPEIEDRWKKEYGKNINLFQLDKVRSIEVIGEKILDWISFCCDVEGVRVFFIDNLMKVTADADNENSAQGAFIEKLYNLAQIKNIHIILIVHTKKIDGLINSNSISGSKKVYNTPDYVLFFQRMDRYRKALDWPFEKAKKAVENDAGFEDDVDFTSYIKAHKIRDRSTYTTDTHLMKYDFKTTCSTELLPSSKHDRVHVNGWSEIVHSIPVGDQPPKLTKGE